MAEQLDCQGQEARRLRCLTAPTLHEPPKVPLVGIQYRLAQWPYGTRGLNAGRGMWRTIANIY
jgi:hypothetical protein